MNPAEERERLRVVKEALDMLAEGEPITLAEAANNGPDAVRQVIRRIFNKLAEHHVVEKVSSPGIAQPMKFRVLHAPALDALRSRDEDVADLIWPGSATGEVPPQTPDPEPEPEPEAAAPPETVVELTLEEKVDRMTALFLNAMQTLIYLRDKVDAMEVKLNALHDVWVEEKK